MSRAASRTTRSFSTGTRGIERQNTTFALVTHVVAPAALVELCEHDGAYPERGMTSYELRHSRGALDGLTAPIRRSL